MTFIRAFYFIIVLLLLTWSCGTSVKTTDTVVYEDKPNGDQENTMVITAEVGDSFNHPTFVIWEEDIMGNFQRTLFITTSYATGVYDYGMVKDSSWEARPGRSQQPAALPYWSFKKGPIEGEHIVPAPEHPYVDAYTGATPSNNFRFDTHINTTNKEYRILLEVNQTADWNRYWTNNKYPNSNAYKHSAQPSLIYAVTVNQEDSVYYLNPIGHGDPTGISGKLYTNLGTLTTALEIFSSVKTELITHKQDHK